MEADEKTCPKCAEMVRAAAVICKHCGFNFQSGAQSTPAPVTQKKGNGLRNGCLGVVVLVIGITALGALGSHSPSGKSADATNTSAPTVQPTDISAVQLDRAFKANEVAAHQQYGETPLRVSGRVTGINLDFSNSPYIEFASDNQFMQVQAALGDGSKDKSATVQKGQQLTVLCTGKTDMVIGTVHLSDCELQ